MKLTFETRTVRLSLPISRSHAHSQRVKMTARFCIFYSTRNETFSFYQHAARLNRLISAFSSKRFKFYWNDILSEIFRPKVFLPWPMSASFEVGSHFKNRSESNNHFKNLTPHPSLVLIHFVSVQWLFVYWPWCTTQELVHCSGKSGCLQSKRTQDQSQLFSNEAQQGCYLVERAYLFLRLPRPGVNLGSFWFFVYFLSQAAP